MPKLWSSICAALALLLAAIPVRAIDLPPGAQDVVPNSLSGGGGTAIMTHDLPYELDGGIELLVSQRLRTESSTPAAPPRAYELTVDILNRSSSSGGITSLAISGLAAAANLDVSFNNAAFGNREPSTASRSADGDLVTFTFADSDELDPGNSTRDLRLRFDAAVAPTLVGVVESVNGIAVPVEAVFYQPGQVPGGVTPAWLSATTTGNDGFATFDRFVAVTDAPIGAVQWEGFYAPGASLAPNTTSWQLAIHSDFNSPYTELDSWTLPADQVNETYIGDANFSGTVAVYRFDATLPTTFQPTPGTPYWLMVRSFAPTTSPGFHWSVGEGADDESVQDEVPVQRFFRDGDRAFTLFVPEPEGPLAASVVVAVLAAFARRRSSSKR
jgi:hypothetical protein